MQVQFEALIFDLDGVIVDTINFYYQANKMIADEANVYFTQEWNQQMQGISRYETVKQIVRQSDKVYSEEEIHALAEKKNHHYQALIETLDEKAILPGIFQLIKEAKAAEIKLAIASSSSNAMYVLEKIGLRSYFDKVVTSRDVKRGKPNPEIFLTAAKAIGIHSRNCVAIEDGIAGLTAIKQTDMFSIGVGLHEGMEQADWQVSSTHELTFESVNKKFVNR
ncbi:beta-phosphoglucomutase [Priestia aryabhattai]|uniref:beta-phosphoglucomutase n=1 Tax=Bacillaceae TaxID=186817 RepID=UPI000B9FDB25|nr:MULTISPECIES: beta-phosphoglucomutase [Bacillaceae]MDT2044809.1 beta-phosphoglucomutase [Priestia flexa]OZT12930.1 beta-phosphoglucomutase [Priestia aryabhattai]TDB51991.1 beta-phosphoglucomutase [Bacillus sp. CBEL-1]